MEEKQTSKKWIFIILFILGLWLVGLLISSFFSSGSEEGFEGVINGNVAVIQINGPIVTANGDGIFSEEMTTSDAVIKYIKKANETKNIKAIVFEINSPGGSAVASDEIGQAIKEIEKPTVAWIREVGASGGYWVASSTDHIIANRMSITGSIGVIGSYLEFSEFIERYNVTYNRMTSGKYKDMGSPFKKQTQDEKEIFQGIINEIYEEFVKEVAENREMEYSQVKDLATGQIFTGKQAKELGLVDELGSENEVKAYLEKELNTSIVFVHYKKPKTLIQTLFEGMNGQTYDIGRGIGDSLVENDANPIKI